MYLVPTCGGCGAPGASPCQACHAALSPAALPSPPPGVDRWWAALAHDGPARNLVTNLKYRNRRDGLRWLGSAMAARVDMPVSIVCWVPTTADRLQKRGFDQAHLLAQAVGSQLCRPVRRLLARTDHSHQVGRNRMARLRGPGLVACSEVTGQLVLVVDDVITTGASMGAAGSALAAAGARWVGAVAATARVWD